jgi:hypothetical protein
MQNKRVIQKILCVSALYLAVFPMSNALAQTPQALAMPASTSAPVVVPSLAAVDQQPKLTYRASGTALTVEELSAAQRQKLEDDFFKRAGYTSVQPVNPKTLKPATVAAPKPMHSLSILGVYGPTAAQKVDLSFNGVLHTVTEKSKLGNVLFESIQPGQVVVSYSKGKVAKSANKGKTASTGNSTTVRQTLKPGDVLEIPA